MVNGEGVYQGNLEGGVTRRKLFILGSIFQSHNNFQPNFVKAILTMMIIIITIMIIIIIVIII